MIDRVDAWITAARCSAKDPYRQQPGTRSRVNIQRLVTGVGKTGRIRIPSSSLRKHDT